MNTSHQYMPTVCLIVSAMKERNDDAALFYFSPHPVCSINKQCISF